MRWCDLSVVSFLTVLAMSPLDSLHTTVGRGKRQKEGEGQVEEEGSDLIGRLGPLCWHSSFPYKCPPKGNWQTGFD